MQAWVAAGGPAIGDLDEFLRQVASLRPIGEISLKQVCDHLVGLGLFANNNAAQAECETRTAEWRPPAHEPPSCPAVIDLIHTAGGVAVIAHPARTDQGAVRKWIAAGADGVECHNVKTQDVEQQAVWRAFCSEHELAYSGGTDWHGPVEHWNVHNQTIAGYDAVESCKAPTAVGTAGTHRPCDDVTPQASVVPAGHGHTGSD